MKKILSAIISISFTMVAHSQTFIDAIQLKENMTGAAISLNETTVPVLKRYFKVDTLRCTDLIKNPFLKDFCVEDFSASENAPLLSAGGSLLSSIGNLDVTNLADGFAKFLVKRTKEELNVAFFTKFYEEINKEEYKDARTLFPQTYLTLTAIGNEVYNYQVYINTLRESFEKDLNSLLDNLPGAINDGNYSTFFDQHPDIKATCLSAIYIGSSLKAKVHPGRIITEYDISLLNNVDKNIKASVQTLQLFSESLRSSGTDHYWIKADSVKLLLNDTVLAKIYFGLLYQQAIAENINFTFGSLHNLLATALIASADNMEKYNAFIEDFIRQTSGLTDAIANLSGKEADKVTFADYYNFYNSTLNVIEYAVKVADLPVIKDSINISRDAINKYISLVRTGGNIALDISRRNYSSAVLNVYTLYNFALETFGTNAQTNPGKVKQFFLKYGSFAAALSQAENSDEVAAAIEAVALPSGSSRVKRETAFNVSLNAYTGLFIGHENIKGIKDDKFFNAYGVAAPIGVAVSTGQKHMSYSLFVSLVDLGVVAAYRFKDNTTAQVPTIQLKDIFSPGAFISVGLPRCPVSVNLGAQMGPNLRKIDNNDTSQPSLDNNYNIYWRYSLSFCVDIPLLNFYTKSK